jgi:tetratricopeptide (TPR) repeat protein
VFRLLGLHPGPDITIPAAASLAGLRGRHVRAALAELTRAHLIAEHMPGRFVLHDLLCAYASELVDALDPADLRREASGRMLEHYLDSARAAALLLNPHRDPITTDPPRPGVTPELPDSPGAALAWLASEHQVLSAVIRQAADLGFDTHAWQLAWTLDDFFDRRGHWHDWEAGQHTALDAACRLGDVGAQARARCALGVACDRLGRYEDAHIHLQQALGLYGELDDDTGRAYAHMRLGGLNERQGCYRESLSHARQALSVYGAADHRAGQAEALNLAGWSHARLGDHRQALTYCGQALALQLDIGDRLGEANTWDSLGYAHHGLDDYRRAADCYRYALDLFRDLGYRYYEAVALTHIGDTEHAAGDLHAARGAWQDALAILDDMDRAITVQVRTRVDCPDADQVRAKLQRLADPDRSPVPAPE